MQLLHSEVSPGTLAQEEGTYQQMLFLKLGNLKLALALVLLDGLLDALVESVQLCLSLLLLLQAILENVQADDDKFVLVGKWLLRKLGAQGQATRVVTKMLTVPCRA